MARTSDSVTVLFALLVTPLMLFGQTAVEEFKGQVQLGHHKVKLETNKIYEIVLEHPKDFPLNVISNELKIQSVIGNGLANRKMYCMPTRTGFVDFFVVPPGFNAAKKATCDYVLKVQGRTLGEKPVLREDNKWIFKDPTYKENGNYFKEYAVKLTGNKLYIIDLVQGSPNVDPYLFLEGPDRKIVASDDDSGGNLNARIIYIPPQDGEFRIIATTMTRALGDFTLTVRQAE